MTQDVDNPDGDQSDEPQLTAYQYRLWIEVDRILYQNYLTPRTVTDFWKGDDEGIIFHLKKMKDRVIRSIVIMEYVEVDDMLNRVITNSLLGKAKGRRKGRKFATVSAMLDRLYPQQKLDIVSGFREVPKTIRSDILA